MSLFKLKEDDIPIYQRIYDNIIGKREDIHLLQLNDNFDLNKRFWFKPKPINTRGEIYYTDTISEPPSYTIYEYLLLVAVKHNNFNVFTFLFNHNVDLNVSGIKTDNNYTAIHLSIINRNDRITKMILEKYEYVPYNVCYRGRDLVLTAILDGKYKDTTTRHKLFSYVELIIYVCKYHLFFEDTLTIPNVYANEFPDEYTYMDLIDEFIYEDIEEFYTLTYFFQTYNTNFKEILFYKYPSSLKKTVKNILMIYNKLDSDNKFYLPKEIWLYIFTFMKIIDYY